MILLKVEWDICHLNFRIEGEYISQISNAQADFKAVVIIKTTEKLYQSKDKNEKKRRNYGNGSHFPRREKGQFNL
jgi:hypothetical protein